MDSSQNVRKILHVDMDAFYASVEQRDNPDLRGKAIAVGGNEKRGVITTASYEARKYGIGSAMPAYMAKQKCPHLIFVKPRFEVYREVSQQMRKIFKEYTDVIEPLSLDEAYLDITVHKTNITLATDAAQSIQKQVLAELNLSCSIGVSYCKFLAKIASDLRKPFGITVIKPHQAVKFIEQLPVNKFYGVGKVTAHRMNELGIFFGSDLKAIDQADLIKHFGKLGKFYYNIVRGIDHRPVLTHRERKSLAVERTLAENITNKEDILSMLNPIIDQLMVRLNKHKVYGRTLTLKIKRNDFTILNRSKSISNVYDNCELIRAEAQSLVTKNFDLFGEIRLIGLSISNFQTIKLDRGDQQLTIDFG